MVAHRGMVRDKLKMLLQKYFKPRGSLKQNERYTKELVPLDHLLAQSGVLGFKIVNFFVDLTRQLLYCSS